MRRFNLDTYIEYIRRHNITETTMVPPMAVQIIASCLEKDVLLSSLRLVYCAGSPLDKTIQQRMTSTMSPSARVYQVYGMSESGWITTFFYPEIDESGSVGRLMPNVECM